MRRPFLPNGINPVQGVSMIERRDWKPEEVLRLTLRVLIGFVLSGLLQSLVMHPNASGKTLLEPWKALVLGQLCFHAIVVAAMCIAIGLIVSAAVHG
jgi:hypothetical protein